MAFDIGKKSDRDRLHKAIKTSRDAIDSEFRKSRTEMIRDFVGSWYSSHGSRFPTYVNLINQTARIYTMALAFNTPQVKVNSFDPKLWPFCRKYEIAINRVLQNINLRDTFQAGVLDAFFLMGIFKVRMADSGEKEIAPDVWIDPGKPWVDRISFDDVILDMSAKEVRKMRFVGDRYRASYDKVMARDDFDKKVRAALVPTSKYGYDTGSEYAAEIASGGTVDDDELEPMVWLQDVFLPETDQLITFSGDNTDLPPLKVVEDEDQGPMGPFEVLNLGLVPDNIVPNSPSQNLKPLHDLANRLYRKLSSQASRQKNCTGYEPGSADDAERRKQAKDGEYFLMKNVKAVQDFSTPGVDGGTHAFFLAASEVFNTMAGNPRSIGGLGRVSDTVGQEKLVQDSAGNMIAFMKSAVVECASNICRKIGALMFDDETLTVESSMEAENTGYYVDASWRPGERAGLKDHYDFSVEPNSMSYRPPELKLQQVMGYLQAVPSIFPLVQAGLLDLQELTRLVSEYQNIPELQKVFKFSMPLGESGGGSHQATKPPNTTREVVRGSRSPEGPQGEGLAAVIGQMMQGGGRQQNSSMGAA